MKQGFAATALVMALTVPAMLASVGLASASPKSVSDGVMAVSAGVGSTASSSLTMSKVVSRINLVEGKNTTVDSRQVTLTVAQTENLRNNQQILVTWKGAHPTGGVVDDPNSSLAIQQEFPMVLLQCRGTAATVTPETCWTQFPEDRFRSSGDNFPEFRVDRYATAADRAAIVGAPKARPSNCFQSAAEYWVPFIAVNGSVYGGGPAGGCAGLAPEASTGGGSATLFPSNDTYAATQLDGTGSTKFQIWNDSQNASLGCSKTVVCSLVAIPIEGISCDTAALSLPAADRPQPGDEADAAAAGCLRNGVYAAGKPGQGLRDLGVSGALWWSASNWRNRMTIPLSLAASDNVCDSAAAKGSVNIYGSELLIQATTQWAPAFCLDKTRYSFTHVQVGEPQAANGINSGAGIEAAFVSYRPSVGWVKPVVMAPTAVTGFAIAYDIADASRNEFTSLRLNARILAKLLTESYPALNGVRAGYPALANNPQDLTQDPEFRALNPGLNSRFPIGNYLGPAAATILTMAGGTDVTTALTSYINADPQAHAWLGGTPDPWGMVVNPNYKAIALPVSSWPLLDTFTSSTAIGSNPCLEANPVPILPLIAAPLSRLSRVTQDMQFAINNSQLSCSLPNPPSFDGAKLVANGRQTPGEQFMLGIVPLGDAARYSLDTAALQVQVAASTPDKYTDATGRSFAEPTQASLKAAADLLTPDNATHMWDLPYDSLLTNPAASSAYPGTMLVYTAVPTQGLSQADAAHYAQFLHFVATTGQQSGTGNGKLPVGFLPITAVDGLGALAKYADAAATAVQAQAGTVPALDGSGALPTPIATPRPTPTPIKSSGGGSPTPTGSTGPNSGSGSTTPSPSASAATPKTSASIANSRVSSTPTVSISASGLTTVVSSGAFGLALNYLILLALAGGLMAVAVFAKSAWQARR
jgi:hypothetical protein